jgi:hypothetical protein
MIIKYNELDRYTPEIDDWWEYDEPEVDMRKTNNGEYIKYWDAYDLLEQARGWMKEDFDAVLLKMRFG